MSKTERINKFFEWLHERVKTIHYVTDEQFENIIEKL